MMPPKSLARMLCKALITPKYTPRLLRTPPNAHPRSHFHARASPHRKQPKQRASPPPPPPRSHASTLSWAKYTVSLGFFTGIAILFVRDYLFSIDTVNGSSMSPTISPGAHERGETERIFLLRGPKVLIDLKRGDVVTFWKPHKPDEISIKRVVAMAGDTVYPTRGYATEPDTYKNPHARMNDGLPTNEESAELAEWGKEVEVGKVVVPYGHVWVEGDNWRKSYDSNDFGPISMALIEGRAAKVWRQGKFREIEDRRGKKTKVVPGESNLPDVYLE